MGKLEPALPVALFHYEEQGHLRAETPKWTDKQFARGRSQEARAREKYYAGT